MLNLSSAISGLAFGLSLIIAIGPQNVFILRQGLNRKHVGIVVSICIISDALLIAVGAGGMGAALNAKPELVEVIRYIGAAFLIIYGSAAFIRGLKPKNEKFIEVTKSQSKSKAIITCLAFTWLNPHVYLDTAILLGSVANSAGRNASAFALGAIIGSTLWFTCLGYGAKYLNPLFKKPITTRVLDFAVAILMFFVAITLLIE